MPAGARLQLIAGAGGHGNLRPLTAEIVSFFLLQLAHSSAAPKVAEAWPSPAELPRGALQVTSTGQVATAYPGAATVFSLNLAHAGTLAKEVAPTAAGLAGEVRKVTGAVAAAGGVPPVHMVIGEPDPEHIRHRMTLRTGPGVEVEYEFYRPTGAGRHPVRMILRESLDESLEGARRAEIAGYVAAAQSGTAIVVLAPRPSPPGTEESKSSILGGFYMLGQRAELVGRTLLGMRVDDVIGALNFTAGGATEDPERITAEASGHLALVLLHAAVLDARLRHVTLHDLPPSYAQLLAEPLPKDAPEDVLPRVLLHYDTPDLLRVLGGRASVADGAR